MKKVIETILNTLKLISGLLLLTIFFLYIINIALRYFLGNSWLWIPDFTRLLFIWTVFTGTTYMYGKKGHLVMDFFVSKMRDKRKKMLRFIIDLFQMVLMMILIIKGIEITKTRMRIPFATWDFPTGYAYAAVPICSFIMLVISIHRVTDELIQYRKGGENYERS